MQLTKYFSYKRVVFLRIFLASLFIFLSLAQAARAIVEFIPPPDDPDLPTATITVIKKVINDNGGNLQASDFEIRIFTNGALRTQPFPGQDEPGTDATVVFIPDEEGALSFPMIYDVGEQLTTGYASSTFSEECTGEIYPEEHKTCTIINDDVPALLQVVKNVVNNEIGTKTASDFNLRVSGTNTSTTTFPGSGQGTIVTLDAGEYSVTEDADGDYTTTYSESCSGTIENGAVAYCTVTNTAIPAPDITNVQIINITDSSFTVTWETDHAATSRVVYDTVAREHGLAPPNYGYEFSTVEDATTTTAHSVTVTGLNPSTTYYLRAISHGSPENITEAEFTATTLSPTVVSAPTPSGGGVNFQAGPGTGGGSPSAPPPPAAAPATAPQAVLGEKIIAQVDPTPPAVLGFEALPATGGADFSLPLFMQGVGLLFAGSLAFARVHKK